MNITIEQAQESDTETVSSVLQEAAHWLISQGTPLWKADELFPAKILAEVSGGLFWLAKAEGEVAGCIRFQLEDKLTWPDVPPDESAFIHRIAIRRKFAGGRISAALIDWAKQHACECRRRYLRLDCEAKTRKLCAVYEKNGLRKHSERQIGPYWVARYECELNGSRPTDARDI